MLLIYIEVRREKGEGGGTWGQGDGETRGEEKEEGGGRREEGRGDSRQSGVRYY